MPWHICQIEQFQDEKAEVYPVLLASPSCVSNALKGFLHLYFLNACNIMLYMLLISVYVTVRRLHSVYLCIVSEQCHVTVKERSIFPFLLQLHLHRAEAGFLYWWQWDTIQQHEAY